MLASFSEATQCGAVVWRQPPGGGPLTAEVGTPAGDPPAVVELIPVGGVPVEVHTPNGNMLVEGTRMVKLNKEDQAITFSGTIRSDDVRADNTILSENIAEVRITNVGKGLISDRQRRGIITRILDWLF